MMTLLYHIITRRRNIMFAKTFCGLLISLGYHVSFPLKRNLCYNQYVVLSALVSANKLYY